MVWLQEEHAGTNASKHVTAQPRVRKKAKRCLIGKVGSHSSFLTFTTSHIPTLLMQLMWSQRKRWFYNSITHTLQCYCSFWRHSSRLYSKSRWTRSDERTNNPTRCPRVVWSIAWCCIIFMMQLLNKDGVTKTHSGVVQ